MRPFCSFFSLSLPTIRVPQLQSAFDWSHEMEMEGLAGLFLMSPIVATDEQKRIRCAGSPTSTVVGVTATSMPAQYSHHDSSVRHTLWTL
jgi:hypothetical protein